MNRIKDSQTERNLMLAFVGESQARNRYTYWASKAKKEGYHQIAFIFEETALQEKEHAKCFFNFLEGGLVDITASFPAGKVNTTFENLQAAIEGEYHEHSEIYPNFAKIAKDEGFKKISEVFKAIAVAESLHEKRYKILSAGIEDQSVFKSKENVFWRCRNCGYLHEGLEAPEICPACSHPRGYFERNLNWF